MKSMVRESTAALCVRHVARATDDVYLLCTSTQGFERFWRR